MSWSGGDEIEQQHAALLFEAHPDPLLAVDAEGRFLGCNRAFERLIGHGPEELRTVGYARFLDPADQHRVAEEFNGALTGQVRSFEARGLDHDGAPLHADVTLIPVEVDGAVSRVSLASSASCAAVPRAVRGCGGRDRHHRPRRPVPGRQPELPVDAGLHAA